MWLNFRGYFDCKTKRKMKKEKTELFQLNTKPIEKVDEIWLPEGEESHIITEFNDVLALLLLHQFNYHIADVCNTENIKNNCQITVIENLYNANFKRNLSSNEMDQMDTTDTKRSCNCNV